MAKYRVKTDQGTYMVEADREPTADEVLAAISQRSQSLEETIPRPDSPSGLSNRMDPFARTGFLMSTPQGKEAMEQVGKVAKNAGLEGGGQALGQTLGAPFAAAGGVQIGGALGGMAGNAISQLTTRDKKFSPGEMFAAGVSGAVPGAPLAKAGAKELLKQSAKYGVTNVAAANTASLIDRRELADSRGNVVAGAAGAISPFIGKGLDIGRSSSIAATKSTQDSLNRATLREGRSLGLVVPPAVVAPNAVNNTLQSHAGKAATAQEAIIRNQAAVNDAVRKDIFGDSVVDLSAPFSPIALNTARIGPNLVYEEISKISPTAAGLLAQFKQANADANAAFSAYRASIVKDPALLASAKAHSEVADQMEKAIAAEAKAAGANPDIIERLAEARTKLAQIGLAERAVNKGSGNIDPAIIGDAFDAGEKLTGNLKKIGAFENAFGKYIKDQANTVPSGVDHLKYIGRMVGGSGLGYSLGGIPAAVATPIAIGASEQLTRDAILSPFYQQAFANPSYGPTGPDFAAQLAKFSTMAAGRDAAAKKNN